MNTLRRLLPTLAAVAALTVVASVQAVTYKWVDDKGVVHYTDKMPPEVVEKASVELNKQGVPIKRIEPAPTVEQRHAKAAEEERQRQLAREREVIDRRDRALMQSYTSEDEIELARRRALGTIDTQVQSAQAYTAALVKRRAELTAKRKSYGNDAVPPAIDRELESIERELGKQDAILAEKQRETATVTARYDADRQRWRELRAIAAARQGGGAPDVLPSLQSTRPAEPPSTARK
jgi:hypothetical protein